MSKKNLLIYGAGAIGRGFVPWVFPPSDFQYYFVDTDRKLESALKKRGCTSYMTTDSGYRAISVRSMEDIPAKFDAVITAVGPRNFMGLSDKFMRSDIPIICMENDARLPKMMKEMTGNPNIIFAVPDVITSNTAPDRMKADNPYSLITENGMCYIEDKVSFLGGKAAYIGERLMKMEWTMKLYLHNTVHCIVAYLGYLRRREYIHDAMTISSIQKIASRAMEECLEMIVKMYDVPRTSAQKYAMKELMRFSNLLLFDPISRVAREPLRKLAQGDRLIGAASLCLQAGIVPVNIIKGIVAAMEYAVHYDPDCDIMLLRKKVSNEEFLKMIHITPKEPVYEYLIEAMEKYTKPADNKTFWR